MCYEFGGTFKYFGKVSEKRDYHRSRAHTLYRCTIDIRLILAVGYEGDTAFYVRMLYNLEHAISTFSTTVSASIFFFFRGLGGGGGTGTAAGTDICMA